MKERINKIISSIHWLVVLAGVINIWSMYEEHDLQIKEIFNRQDQIVAEVDQKKKNLHDAVWNSI